MGDGCEDPFGWLFHRLYDGFDFGFIDFGCMVFYRISRLFYRIQICVRSVPVSEWPQSPVAVAQTITDWTVNAR